MGKGNKGLEVQSQLFKVKYELPRKEGFYVISDREAMCRGKNEMTANEGDIGLSVALWSCLKDQHCITLVSLRPWEPFEDRLDVGIGLILG